MKTGKLLLQALLLCNISVCFAGHSLYYDINQANAAPLASLNPVEERAYKEELIPQRYIGIAFHKPNYALPFYYTGSPDNNVYANKTPDNERLKKIEVKYQLSLKVPVWKNIWNSPSTIYFAYTLRTYWQAYNREIFIRETDYQPELFLSTQVDCTIINDWHVKFFNLGYDHQSNGYGNSLQRSWDRIYLEAVTSFDDWLISFKPWVIVHKNERNENIGSYLGYGSLLFAYKFPDYRVFSFQITNLFVNPKRTTVDVTWSFPITPYIKGYAEFFSGYGQSLIEYNHRTNSFGLGFAVSDWI